MDLESVYEDEQCDEVDLFSEETLKKIMFDKAGQPNRYKSHWEDDEEDIDKWTKVKVRCNTVLF